MSSEAPPTPSSGSKSSKELRAEVEEARARLASTVGELGNTIDETRARVVSTAKKAAPIAGGIIASYIVLKLARRLGRGHDDS